MQGQQSKGKGVAQGSLGSSAWYTTFLPIGLCGSSTVMLSVSQGDGLCPLSASGSLYQPLPYPGIPALFQQATLPSAENGRFVCSEELPIHLGPCQILSSTQLFSLIFYSSSSPAFSPLLPLCSGQLKPTSHSSLQSSPIPSELV